MLPEDLYRIVWIEDAQISPDGRRVAVVRKWMNAEHDHYRSEIWLAETVGGEPRRFTAGPREDSHPRWSPDGHWLAFLSNRGANGGGEKKQIWLLPVSGGEARRLTVQAEGVSSFAWAPDSLRIAFVARVRTGPERHDAERQDADSNAPARIIGTLRYKSNGDGFVYNRRLHLFVLSLESAETLLQVTGGDCDDVEPCWSPDGRTIAFSSAGHDNRDFGTITDIFAVDAAGGDLRRLTAGTGTAHSPAFSPDGGRIAYYGHESPHPGGSRNLVLWVINVGGSEPRPLTQALDRTAIAESAPIWASGGDAILIGILDRGTSGLYAVPAAGGDSAILVGGERLLSSWTVSAAGSRIAFTASTPVEPPDLFVCERERWLQPAGEHHPIVERRLSNVNAGWLAEVQLSQPRSFHFSGAGGLQIEGWVMPPSPTHALPSRHPETSYSVHPETSYSAHPEPVEGGAPVPTLLNVHGGPHSFYGWGFFDEFQVQAGAGYAVIYINPRGSQGYGEAFAQACCGDWGGGDYEDLMRGLDEALDRHPFLDRTRIGVLGGSYGGFMTSWIVGHTDRFPAAVSERAVNAPVSLFGTSDIGYWFEHYELGGDPFANRDTFLERSPLSYAAQISTPLLIMHSENDLRCPIEQAEQLYVALKLLGRADTVFVRFPEENHELSRSGKPSRRVERFQILLDWFDRYLQQDEGRTPRSAALRQAMASETTAKAERK